jgi:hypothetical protein
MSVGPQTSLCKEAYEQETKKMESVRSTPRFWGSRFVWEMHVCKYEIDGGILIFDFGPYEPITHSIRGATY